MPSAKSLARDIFAQAVYAIGASKPSKACRGKLLILTFHRVLPEELRRQYPMPGLAVTPQELEWILKTLLPDFELATVSDAVRKLRRGTPAKPLIAVSFDDGQWDNLEYAAPVLESLSVRATFYVPTDYVGQSDLLWHDRAAFAWSLATPATREIALKPVSALARMTTNSSVGSFLEALKGIDPGSRDGIVNTLYTQIQAAPAWARLMTWPEVAKLRQAGHEVGSHSRTHALLPQLDEQGQREELAGSKAAIVQALGVEPTSLCYPNGSFDERSVKLAAELGYENAVTTRWGVNEPQQPAYELLRCDMDAKRLKDRHGQLSRARLAMRISGYQPGL